ncbi:HypC/HybG/HupF family hydrogenase formation chaperone [Streptomyces deccanensis]|uniref:HypC/HybG/HupF family hydrogenase formation chaperone n=1 Tax=Streptomyces deccanensis TaxID=424188 RepID=UPI001EFA798D|nr:HypC/HybG/HupF family hydrogenase formation chaperone [Streptomyces deccanensis]ULR48087.1 HypC/HybG/HupF family hydrogenase formation chaperone [Streptomyces deccanensis]
MCLAVPGRVLDIEERDGTRMATVDFGGVVKEVCLEYLPDLRVGEYAIVHVGFALQRLDEESARQTLELFAELGMLQEEFGDAWEMAAAEAGVDPVGVGPVTEARLAEMSAAEVSAEEVRDR